MAGKKKRKVRAEFRKNRTARARRRDWTQQLPDDGSEEEAGASQERISGKGELTRKRTIVTTATDDDAPEDGLAVDEADCLQGRVLSVRGLVSDVETTPGQHYQCVTRRLLRTLATEQRHVVAAGDRVTFRPTSETEGMILKIAPRYGTLSRMSRRRRQIIVTNVDQILIVVSAAEPPLKPNLIDRFLVAAEQSEVRPIVCINKIDLIDPALLQPLVGTYSQLGFTTLLTSAESGAGMPRLRQLVQNKATAVAGQSGVGKSSLLNVLQPGLGRRVASVSSDTQKGRHTTTTAQLCKLDCGGYIVDTPGMRQFELWDVIPKELAGFFPDLRPFVATCRYPDCTHTHEEDCAVKDAVADDLIDARRYDSYCRMLAGEAT